MKMLATEPILLGKQLIKNAFLVYDEYYHALLSAKFSTNESGKIVNLMGIANYGKQRILFGGTCNPHFRKVLSLLILNVILHEKYLS